VAFERSLSGAAPVSKDVSECQTVNSDTNLTLASMDAPLLTKVLYVLAGLSIFGGTMLFIGFLPKYLSFIWLMGSIVQAVLLIAIGKILEYVNCIAINVQKNSKNFNEKNEVVAPRKASIRKSNTYYKILNISNDASPETIYTAYKSLSKKYNIHLNPDNPESAKIIEIINNAYTILSDPLRRKEHDEWIKSQVNL
jgi:hypothetical protein